MWGPGYGYGYGGWGWGWLVLNWVFWIVLVVIAVGVMARIGGGYGERRRRSPGLDALEERYARGEIPRDEFLQKKHDILTPANPNAPAPVAPAPAVLPPQTLPTAAITTPATPPADDAGQPPLRH